MEPKNFVVLMAEDNKHDILATERAWEEQNIANKLYIVRNGEECIDYLNQRGKYIEPGSAPRPGIIMLDIKMPKVDGLEVLKHIKENEDLKRIPVIMLTTSKEDEDRIRSYDLGATAFIAKPIDYNNFSAAVKAINCFWALVEMPD